MSRPSNIFLVRHGESEANADKGVYAKTPDWRIELTPEGHHQALQAGVKLKETLNIGVPAFLAPIVGVYVSPYRRAVQTWDRIAESFDNDLNIHFVKQDPRLRELERGNPSDRDRTLVEYRLTERERHKQGSFFYRVKDGESGAQCYDRVASFHETLERTAEYGYFPPNLIIVGHSFTQRVVEMVLGELDVDAFHALRDPANAEIVHLTLHGDRYLRA